MAYRARMSPWPRVARRLLRIVLRLVFRPRLVGAPPRDGGYLLVANHRSWLDGFFLLAEFPPEPRLHFFADLHGATARWWQKPILDLYGGFVYVDRRAAMDRSAIDDALGILRDGGVLMFYPEGLPQHDEEKVDRFRRGVGFLALHAGVPVLPVFIRGTAELYLGRPIEARVGDLVHLPELPATRENTERVAATLRDAVLALAVPWDEPAGARKRMRWLTHLF